MGKKLKISLIIAICILGFAYGAFLFLVPVLIKPNNYTEDIKKAVKDASGLEIEPGTLKLHTYLNLSVGVTAEGTQILIPGNKKPTLQFEKAGVKVKLLPLLLKRIEFAEVYLNSPEINLIKLKGGKYDIENAIKITEVQPSNEQRNGKAAAQTNSALANKNPEFTPVFDGIDIVVKNYKLNLTDKSGAKQQFVVLKGDLIKISEFKPDKFVKVATKGQFAVGNEPRITYDVALAADIPQTEQAQDNNANVESSAKPVSNVPVKRIDPLEGILKYNLKADIKADLKVKNGKTPKDMPDIKGFLDFNGLSFNVDGKALPDSYGKFKFSGKKMDVDSKLYITPASFIAISGNVDDIGKQDFDLNVKSSDIRLNDVKKFAYTLADAVKADTTQLKDIGLGGSLKADFNVKKNDFNGYLTLKNIMISHKELSRSLKNFNSSLKFGKEKVVFENTSGYVGDIKFTIAGDISSKMIANVKVSAPAIKCATVYGIVNNSKMFADLKPQMKDINSVSGSVSLEALVKGDLSKQVLPQIRLTANKVHAYHIPSKLPVTISSGNITTDTINTKLNDILVKIADSPVTVNGEITGSPDDLNVSAQANIDKLSTLFKVNSPTGTSSILSVNANVKPTVVTISNSGLFAASNKAKDKNGLKNLVSARKILAVEGTIADYSSKDPVINKLNVDISGLSVSLLEPKGSVQLDGNVVVKGKASSPKVLGSLSIKNINVPLMQFKAKEINLALKDTEILAKTDVIDMAGSKFVVSAAIENNLQPPFKVKSAKVTSDYANLDKLQAAMQAIDQAMKSASVSSAGQASRSSSAKAVTSQTAPPDVPLLISNGTFSAKQLVVSNLPVENVTCDFVINPINEVKIRNIKGDISSGSGGTIAGVSDMNLKTTKFSMDITANNVEMNGLATAMANMPGEIYGSAKGHIKLVTIGQTPEETAQNAVGRVDFEVKNGRLPKLGSIEYLLGARNLSLKGLTNGLLSKSLGFDEAGQTTQFDTLTGVVHINRGTLNVEQVKMQGKYLSSFVTGMVKMNDNYADLTLLNRLSATVVRRLGPVANISGLSVDELVKKIPGQWGQLLATQLNVQTGSNNSSASSDKYKNRDKIPALTSESSPEDREFAVKIIGNMNNPTAVRSFEWLPAVQTEAQP